MSQQEQKEGAEGGHCQSHGVYCFFAFTALHFFSFWKLFLLVFSVQEERETARVHRVVEWRLFLFLFLLYTVLINSSAIQSTKLGNTASVEGSGGGVMGRGEALQTVCSSLDAKGSFFAKTCGVIRISCWFHF